jgi:signal transduction histidine kinase
MGTAIEQVLETGEAVLADHTGLLGASMLLPLVDSSGVRSVVVAARQPDRRHFTAVDLEMGRTFATHASLALELAEARQDQQRMALLEDRTRIAHDLHDHVIQQLFAAGMTLQGVAMGLGDQHAAMLDKVVDTLDEAVKQIRTSIFQLRPHAHTGASLRSAVLTVVAELVPALGFEPRVDFDGPLDAVSDAALSDDALAVVREALSNTAKHARAGSAAVRLTASSTELHVEVSDDGVGMGRSERRSGLGNLRTRAELRGGTLTIAPPATGQGMVLTWSVPLG